MLLITFSGYLTKDATASIYGENAVLNFTVATHSTTGKKDENGNFVNETTFLSCSRWYKGNDFPKIIEYMKKGQRVLIVGNRLATSENVKDGKSYFNLHVNVQSIELIGSSTQQEEQQGQVPPFAPSPSPTSGQGQPTAPPRQVPNIDDDMPF